MFDSIFNLVIILIPLSIFIGRAIVQARSKHAPPPKIPVHFEDEEEGFPGGEASEYMGREEHDFFPSALTRGATEHPKGQEAPPVAAKKRAPRVELSPLTGVMPAQKPPAPAGKALSPGGLAINHLSPMQQAVVMAEVLGPPKGMKEAHF